MNRKEADQLTFLAARRHAFTPSFTAFPPKFPAGYWLPQGKEITHVIRVITSLISDLQRRTKHIEVLLKFISSLTQTTLKIL